MRFAVSTKELLQPNPHLGEEGAVLTTAQKSLGCIHVCGGVIHNSQKVEDAQVSTHRRMGKQNVLNPYSRTALIPKRKDILALPTTCMNLEGIMLHGIATRNSTKSYTIHMRCPK